MDIKETYLICKKRVESNLTNGGIVLDMPRFVLTFNMCTLKFIDNVLDKKNDITIEEIQLILEKDKVISGGVKGDMSIAFPFPSNFYEFTNVRIKATKGECSVTDMLVWQVKNENVHELLADINNVPSFKHRETFYTIGGDNVCFYVDSFDIPEIYLTYYRYPIKVDIAGYVHQDGTASTNIDCEFDDKIVNRIIDICVKEFNKSEHNSQYELDNNEVYNTK